MLTTQTAPLKIDRHSRRNVINLSIFLGKGQAERTDVRLAISLPLLTYTPIILSFVADALFYLVRLNFLVGQHKREWSFSVEERQARWKFKGHWKDQRQWKMVSIAIFCTLRNQKGRIFFPVSRKNAFSDFSQAVIISRFWKCEVWEGLKISFEISYYNTLWL